MNRACVWLAALALGAALPLGAQTPDSAAEFREFQKFNATLEEARQRNARAYAIDTASGIDEAKYVDIGGIPQWITIRGERRDNPVLLLLHGGPGGASNPFGYAVLRPWLAYFTVVQWDQRGAGRTLGRNGAASAELISPDRLTRDGIELAELLRKELHQDKIVLVGHSWGSLLGVLMARARPDLFSAYVGTGQVADPGRNFAVGYDELLREAERRHERQAMAELQAIGPPPWPDGRGFETDLKWAGRFGNDNFFGATALGLALRAPGYTLKDLNDWWLGEELSDRYLYAQAPPITAEQIRGAYGVPVIVIQGEDDFITPASLAREFVNSIQAPHKEFTTIPDAGHSAIFTRTDLFLRELVKRVRPLAGR